MMMLFTLPPRRNAKPPIDGPLTAPAYITLRRQAAGLSRHQVAHSLAARGYECRRTPRDAARYQAALGEALALVDQLETPGATARYRETIEILGSIFSLDPDVYYQLANEPADRHPSVCRGCGCSDHDTCCGDAGICSWLTSTACTRCVDGGLSAAERR